MNPQQKQVAVPAMPQASALDEVTAKLSGFPGLVGIALTADGSIRIMVSVIEAANQIKGRLGNSWPLPGGQRISLSTIVSPPNQLHYGQGSQIANQGNINNVGTFGARLTMGGEDAFLLSCWHVLKDNSFYTSPPLNNNIILSGGAYGGTVIARIVTGALTDKTDAGIARLENPAVATPPLDDRVAVLGQYRAVIAYDSAAQTEVVLFGAASGYRNATIFDHQFNASLPYDDGSDHMVNDTFSIVLKQDDGTLRAPTAPGDSGALVVEKSSGTPLGIIVGGNGTYSYAVKCSNLFDPQMPYHGYTFTI